MFMKKKRISFYWNSDGVSQIYGMNERILQYTSIIILIEREKQETREYQQ